MTAEGMLRLYVPGGLLTSTQMKAIAQVAADHAGDQVELTPRQEIQLQPAPDKMPDVVASLEALGLGCAPSGFTAEETVDTPPGIREQEEEGLFSVTVPVPEGRLSGRQIAKAADLAERHGDGKIGLTAGRGLFLGRLPKEKVAQVLDGLDSVGLKVR